MLTILLSAVAFVLLLTLLILIHELGHFSLARFFGVEVEEFGFGLPPRAKTLFKQAGTIFTLNWIPFGGFVRLKGENALDEADRREEGSFGRAGFLAKVSILLGGVAMNFALALVLLTVGFSFGRWIPSWYASLEELDSARARGEISATLSVLITDVLPGGGAAEAGIGNDTLLIAIDGTPVADPADVSPLQEGKRSVTYTLRAPTADEPFDVPVALDGGKSGVEIQLVATDLSAPTRPLLTGFSFALRESSFMAKQTVLGIGELFRSIFTRARVPEGISGIVGIAVLTHGSVQEGFMTYLRLVALLSLSLAILNVLPLPALDGGRLLFVLIEGVIRRPLNRRLELMTNAAGFAFLMGLIIVITVNDIWHLF